MDNISVLYGLTNGPDIHICSADGVQDEKLDLDGAGVLRVGGLLIAMTADLTAYLKPEGINTLAKLNAIVAGSTLIDTGDARLSDARAPLAHTHLIAEITDLPAYLTALSIDTLAELNIIIADGTLIDTSDARLSDARTPLAHTHPASDLASGEVSVARGGTGSDTASDARTALGLGIGTDIQAFDAGLLSIAALTTAANEMIYTTGSDAYAVAVLSVYARTLLDDDDAAAARTTLELATMSQAEAEAGTETTTRAITAQRLKQSIDALGGAGMVDLIEAQSTAGVSNTDYVTGITSVYKTVVLMLYGWEPVTDGAGMEIVTSANAGSSWDEAAGSYAWAWGEDRNGSATRSGSDSDVEIQLTNAAISNVAGEGAGGEIWFHGPQDAGSRCMIDWHLGFMDTNGTARMFNNSGTARRLANAVMNGIRIRASDGNHKQSSALFGIKHA